MGVQGPPVQPPCCSPTTHPPLEVEQLQGQAPSSRGPQHRLLAPRGQPFPDTEGTVTASP